MKSSQTDTFARLEEQQVEIVPVGTVELNGHGCRFVETTRTRIRLISVFQFCWNQRIPANSKSTDTWRIASCGNKPTKETFRQLKANTHNLGDLLEDTQHKLYYYCYCWKNWKTESRMNVRVVSTTGRLPPVDTRVPLVQFLRLFHQSGEVFLLRRQHPCPPVLILPM